MNHGHDRHSPALLARLWRPMSWPRWTRRAFVLLLPLALPIWMLLNLAGVGRILLHDLGEGLDKYWNGRQRRYYRNDGYYTYARDRRDDDIN